MTSMSDSIVFDFTSLDHASVQQDLLRFIQSENWTNFNSSNEGSRIIELLSYLTDLLAYTDNTHTLETIPKTIIREQNFRNYVEAFDYEMHGPSPSKTTLEYTLDPAALPIVIPATHQVRCLVDPDVVFEPDTEGTAVSTTYTVTATQGQTTTDSLGNSNGLKNQSFLLSNTNVLLGTLVVTVGSNQYRRVSNPVEAGSTDRTYIVKVSESGAVRIIFGDGVNGTIPPAAQAISCTYRYLETTDGNCPVNTATEQVVNIPGVLSVRNVTAAEQGGPKQSLASAKLNFPLWVKANSRAVTESDYAAQTVSKVPGVLRARATFGAYQAGGNPVILFIVPVGGGALTTTLANTIVNTLRFGIGNEPGCAMVGKRILPRTASYVNLQIEVDVHVQKSFRRSIVEDRVRSAYIARLSPESVNFAEALSVQHDAYDIVDPEEMNIPGLSRVFIRRFSVRPVVGRYLYSSTTGNGTAIGIVTTQAVSRREWSIRITQLSDVVPEFVVTQRRLGTVAAVGDMFLLDDGNVYRDNELTGMRLRPREQEQSDTWLIEGNTKTQINVTGVSTPSLTPSLLLVTDVGDSYVVEKTEVRTGKIAQAQPTESVAAGSVVVVPVDTVLGFAVGDTVLVREGGTGTGETVMMVIAVGSLSLTLQGGALTFGLTIDSTIDSFWLSDDGTVGFSVVQGSIPFVNGDEFYVDTYDTIGDITLRKENFPLLSNDDLVVNVIGGVM